jgi:hypothetical protein
MKYLLLLSCVFVFGTLNAQKAGGAWYGKADVDLDGYHNNYLTELVIKQKGNDIEGIFGYYFKDRYVSFYIRGHYNPNTREIIIRNIPLIYYNSNSTINSIDCNTDFMGKLVISRTQTTMTGHFYHDGKYKYTCPDLRVNYTLAAEEKTDSSLKNRTADQKIWKPQPDDYVVNVNPSKNQVPVVNAKLDSGSNHQVTLPAPAPVNASAELIDAKKISEAYGKRKNMTSQILDVVSDSIRLSFYDNGDIDGDSISVFVNSNLMVAHQLLSARAINMYVKLDSTKEINEIGMFAENLGSIPPNTALMVLTDGVNRYEVYMSSSLTLNSTVKVRRKRK